MTQEEIQSLNTKFDEFKQVNDQILSKMQKGEPVGELKEKLDRINTRLQAAEDLATKNDNERLAAETKSKALEAKCQELEALILKKGKFSNDEPENMPDKMLAKKRLEIFTKVLRFGLQNAKEAYALLTEVERKTLVLGNDTASGYLAPIEYINEIITDSIEFSPLRQHARVRTTTKSEVVIPRRLRTGSATWVAERTVRAATQDPAWGLESIKIHEMYAMTPITQVDLEDSGFDLMAFIRADQSEQFGVAEGAAFISGDNVSKPEGILTNSEVDYTANGHATELKADGLISIYYDLKEAYLQNAMWLASRSTLKTIRQMKEDGTSGQYLWAPGIRTDARPATILDRPYAVTPDMPAIAENAFPVAFGDFRRGYTIVDRLVMDVMVDPYKQKDTGTVEISARKRVGGIVVLPEAIRKLKMATS